MSVTKKVITSALLYIGYQVFFNKKYASYRDELIDAYRKNKNRIADSLDNVSLYLNTPIDAGTEINRIKIDNEIQKIKEKLLKVDDHKVAEQVVNTINKATDIIADSLKKVSSKK
jgi:hypothetical protein